MAFVSYIRPSMSAFNSLPLCLAYSLNFSHPRCSTQTYHLHNQQQQLTSLHRIR